MRFISFDTIGIENGCDSRSEMSQKCQKVKDSLKERFPPWTITLDGYTPILMAVRK
jgi:hypothetical protein